jgi:hypothetical protein
VAVAKALKYGVACWSAPYARVGGIVWAEAGSTMLKVKLLCDNRCRWRAGSDGGQWRSVLHALFEGTHSLMMSEEAAVTS